MAIVKNAQRPSACSRQDGFLIAMRAMASQIRDVNCAAGRKAA